MIEITYYDDTKERHDSHEISIIGEYGEYNAELNIDCYNPFEITGYGSSKEKALSNFKKKFDFVFAELQAFKNRLDNSDIEIKPKFEQ